MLVYFSQIYFFCAVCCLLSTNCCLDISAFIIHLNTHNKLLFVKLVWYIFINLKATFLQFYIITTYMLP